jgi:hypothetical protein
VAVISFRGRVDNLSLFRKTNLRLTPYGQSLLSRQLTQVAGHSRRLQFAQTARRRLAGIDWTGLLDHRAKQPVFPEAMRQCGPVDRSGSHWVAARLLATTTGDPKWHCERLVNETR